MERGAFGYPLNPAASGYLVAPVWKYPGSKLVGVLGIFFNLTANPFLLPNLVAGVPVLWPSFSLLRLWRRRCRRTDLILYSNGDQAGLSMLRL